IVERILRRTLRRAPALPVLLADEQTYGHANDPLLAYLVRRFPPETARAHIVPVAALLAESPDGGHVIERWDVKPLFDAYLKALFSWNVALFRYRSEEHTSELQSRENLVCRLLLEKKNNK